MSIPNAIRIPVPFEYVFPNGALCMGVEPMRDFEKRGQADEQARDENGVRIWVVKVLDLDPEAGKFGRSAEMKIKIAAEHQPVPPESKVPGYPPAVAFTDVVLTPYVDSQRCKGNGSNCRARLAYSVRASGLVDPTTGELPKNDPKGGKAA